MIYFVRPVGQRGPVKIGFSGDPTGRLCTMQVGSPVRLELVAVIDAPVRGEHQLHDQFREFQVHGEWFEPTPDLDDLIAKYAVVPVQAPVRSLRRPQAPVPFNSRGPWQKRIDF